MGKVTKALAALALGAVTAYLFPRRKDSSLPVGESSYFLEDRSGTCGEPIPVYYYKPATWTEDQPVFIAFPGYTRKAERFEKHLEELAVRYNMLIACPEFPRRNIPAPGGIRKEIFPMQKVKKGRFSPGSSGPLMPSTM